MTSVSHPDLAALLQDKKRWLVTGAAGFIGSNLVETLVAHGQDVVGLDNFSTGYQDNIDEALADAGGPGAFKLINGDIRDYICCVDAVAGMDIVLHQAALGSVPRSLAEPLATHEVNVTGFLNMLDAARVAGVGRFIYAASSSTYGDEPALPKVEDRIGNPLSPYAVTKLANELYAAVYARSYGFKATGLRYFNVFGKRQDPDGAYAAVIPKWIAAMVAGSPVVMNGDGSTSRDFCHVANAVQANIRAALSPDEAQGEIYNIAFGGRTTLAELFVLIRDQLQAHQVHYGFEPQMEAFRPGDVLHSQADIGKATRLLDYRPTHSVSRGLAEALPWYLANNAKQGVGPRR